MSARKAILFLIIAAISLAVAGSPTVLASPESGLTPIEELGKFLLFDTNLSTPHGQSCAACHGPEEGITGAISRINAVGAVYPGEVHTRLGNRKPSAVS